MTAPDSQWAQQLEARLARGDERMGRIEAQLATNTETTMEVRDILETAKGAFRVLAGLGQVGVWVGKLAAAGMAIWGVIYAFTHGGRPPGGH